jgi:hypothetical protein
MTFDETSDNKPRMTNIVLSRGFTVALAIFALVVISAPARRQVETPHNPRR